MKVYGFNINKCVFINIEQMLPNEDNKYFFSLYLFPTVRIDRWWKNEYCLFIAWLFWEIWITNRENEIDF